MAIHPGTGGQGCSAKWRGGPSSTGRNFAAYFDQLDGGDVLMVTRLDQLARSTRDLLNTLAAITAKKVGFKSLGDTWADTTTSHGAVDADRARRSFPLSGPSSD